MLIKGASAHSLDHMLEESDCSDSTNSCEDIKVIPSERTKKKNVLLQNMMNAFVRFAEKIGRMIAEKFDLSFAFQKIEVTESSEPAWEHLLDESWSTRELKSEKESRRAVILNRRRALVQQKSREQKEAAATKVERLTFLAKKRAVIEMKKANFRRKRDNRRKKLVEDEDAHEQAMKDLRKQRFECHCQIVEIQEVLQRLVQMCDTNSPNRANNNVL